jgi:hypothetical protein
VALSDADVLGCFYGRDGDMLSLDLHALAIAVRPDEWKRKARAPFGAQCAFAAAFPRTAAIRRNGARPPFRGGVRSQL